MIATLEKKNTGRFEKGMIPWNFNLKGYMRANITSFKKGQVAHNKGLHIPTGLVKAKDITGQKFNRWTAIKRTTKQNNYWSWIFKCDCGSEKELSITTVQSGGSKSCGCLFREKMKERVGISLSLDVRKKMSERAKGSNNNQWKGGVTPITLRDRNCLDMKSWKRAILERDNYTCQKSGKRGGRLAVHHIHNFSSYPELRFSIDNGVTLDFFIHKEFHKIYGVKNNTREQLEEFINNKNI